MEILFVNLAIVFAFFWGFQMVRDRRRYRQILTRREGGEEIPVDDLVEAFFRSDDRVAEIRRYVKISKEELLSDVKSTLEAYPGRDKLLGHLREVIDHRQNAQKVIAAGEMELEEMQKMLFFASFLSAKEHILGFIYNQRFQGDYLAELSSQAGGASAP